MPISIRKIINKWFAIMCKVFLPILSIKVPGFTSGATNFDKNKILNQMNIFFNKQYQSNTEKVG